MDQLSIIETHIVPIVEESELPQPAVCPKDLGLNSEGVKKAAEKLGLSMLDSDYLLASHTLGNEFKKVGVLKIGRVLVYSAGMHAQKGIEECNDVLESVQDPEIRAGLLPTKLHFVRTLGDMGDRFIRSAELDGNDDTNKSRGIKPFAAGGQAGPVIIANQAVVNNQTNK